MKSENVVDHSHDAMSIHAILDTIFVYTTVNGCSRGGEYFTLVVDESLHLGDFTKFSDCMLLDDKLMDASLHLG